jgi:hypothetical protein
VTETAIDAVVTHVVAVIESMTGARFVHDRLELAGWDVRIADAIKARGLAPLACKTDTIDCWVLAELARLQLIPEIWLPDPSVRAEREQARFRVDTSLWLQRHDLFGDFLSLVRFMGADLHRTERKQHLGLSSRVFRRLQVLGKGVLGYR